MTQYYRESYWGRQPAGNHVVCNAGPHWLSCKGGDVRLNESSGHNGLDRYCVEVMCGYVACAGTGLCGVEGVRTTELGRGVRGGLP